MEVESGEGTFDPFRVPSHIVTNPDSGRSEPGPSLLLSVAHVVLASPCGSLPHTGYSGPWVGLVAKPPKSSRDWGQLGSEALTVDGRGE